jgi:tetratricopeptide (TPR) repeat protein
LIRWAFDLAKRGRTEAHDADWVEHMRDLKREQENLRGAIDRALVSDPQSALAIADALWPFWLWDGDLAEGRRWLTKALEAATSDPILRARATLGLGALTGRSGDPRRHAQLATEAGALLHTARDHAGEARALQFRGIAHWAADELPYAEEAFSRSLAIVTALGWAGGRAAALTCLGVVRAYGNELAEAARLVSESEELLSNAPISDIVPPMLDLGESIRRDPKAGMSRLVFEQTFAPFRDMTPAEALGHVLLTHGRLARLTGDALQARVLSVQAREVFGSTKDDRGAADALASIGALEAELGDVAGARQAFDQSLAIRRRLGDFRGAALAEANLGDGEAEAGRFDDAARHLSAALDSFRRHGDAWGIAATLGNLAGLALRQGDEAAARNLLEESLAACRTTGRKRWVAWTLLRLAALSPRGASNASLAEAMKIFEVIGDAAGSGEATELVRSQRSRYARAKAGSGGCRRSHTRRSACRPN